eukprot:CAMPEP_0206516880 /NCGR_PEP_ID=MMETSP0324_2-20121206/63617_1 /ASSEMBLY_ACC=CAM_ASM_000836 /TAXON_ID=2866 /ORGANISM="Crypthecodinium cohnii, Strain Seligo" /LENGTH=125 /DNA_ID=CAMNT_0054009871 /DNA_START=169 /DNA_END=545 /DNA_ORIENTATION=-
MPAKLLPALAALTALAPPAEFESPCPVRGPPLARKASAAPAVVEGGSDIAPRAVSKTLDKMLQGQAIDTLRENRPSCLRQLSGLVIVFQTSRHCCDGDAPQLRHAPKGPKASKEAPSELGERRLR